MEKSLLYLIFFLTVSFNFPLFVLFQTTKTQKEIERLANLSLVNFQREKEKITVFFVGDILLDRGVKRKIEMYGDGDFKFPFLKIVQFLNKADLLIGNLEGPISDKGKKVGSIYSFRMNPKAIDGLKFAGFDVVSLANNHILDYGKVAMEDTFLRLKEAGIDYVGGGFNGREACSPKIKVIKGTKIAFLAFTNLGSPFWQATGENSGICWLNEENLEKSIKESRERADIVFVLFHFGDEYQEKSNPIQKYFSHLAIDFGADLIVGHHPHVVQEIEEYKGKYIAYSLGNFIFDQDFSNKTMEGMLLKVLIKEKKIKQVSPLKIKINQYFQAEMIK